MISAVEPVLVSVNEGAQLIGVKRSKFYALAKEGKFKILKMGRKSVVEVASIRTFANSIAA